MSDTYVHGYSAAEETRLIRQAGILVEFIHSKALFASGSRVLEAGCGIGAQTVELAARNPQVDFVAIDRSRSSIEIARRRLDPRAAAKVDFQVADIHDLPFPGGAFDGVFLCFVLEHLSSPQRALAEIRRVLKPGAKVHAFEGDHGSVLAWPNDPAINRLVSAVSEYQCLQRGNPFIGRGLCPILRAAGFQDVAVEPCVAYADATRPAWIDGFTRATFTDMMLLQREVVISQGLLSDADWCTGMQALECAAGDGGTFSYTFYRATATR